MEYSLVANSISRFGLNNDSPLEARRKASVSFTRALNRGKSRAFWRRLWRQEYRLRHLAEVNKAARHRPVKNPQVVNISLSQIVGSEGRTRDFDNAFNPLASHNQERWVGIAAARRQGVALPPVELVQVDDVYYIRDGHHRVSVAKAAGQAAIEAQVVAMMASGA